MHDRTHRGSSQGARAPGRRTHRALTSERRKQQRALVGRFVTQRVERRQMTGNRLFVDIVDPTGVPPIAFMCSRLFLARTLSDQAAFEVASGSNTAQAQELVGQAIEIARNHRAPGVERYARSVLEANSRSHQ